MYAVNKELFSADGYYALPVSELHYSYYLAAYDSANIATQFALSATRDTTVHISLPSNGKLVSLALYCIYLGIFLHNICK